MKRLFFRISLLCFSLLCFSAFTQTPALKCSEGEYYCETELACKPANELCTILSCDDKVVFGYTGADRNYIVPADVTKIEVKAWGAGGSGVRNFSASGVWGYTRASLSVIPGSQYIIVVGEWGQVESTRDTYGFGGGGGNYLGGSGTGSSGGGLSWVFLTTVSQANARIIAGGAGGSGFDWYYNNNFRTDGGSGGGLIGQAGDSDFRNGGGGGTQNEAGLGADLSLFPPGRWYSWVGMQWGRWGSTYSASDWLFGSGWGGGGGYFGWGGGMGSSSIYGTRQYSSGGWWGSGRCSDTGGDCITQGSAGYIVPYTTDEDYIGGIGASGFNNNPGGNGLVVIHECRPKPTVACNNNNTCDANESCDCIDCYQTANYCGLDAWNTQMVCTGDIIPPITPTSVASDPAVSPDVTSTFSITKLLAKSIWGVCPTDASVYVSNLTDVLPNEELCVRLVYNNATTGAVSNALITDSLPTGFTRVDNSTKNCLTPTGSPELCSNATWLWGAIGNNWWTGNDFSLTPHAGFYTIPINKTTGDIMEMGRKRYAHLQECLFSLTGSTTPWNSYNLWSNGGFEANNSSGGGTPNCSGRNYWFFNTQLMSFQEATTDLLGERYAHLQECTYKNQLNSLFFTSNVSHSNQQLGGGFVANNSNYRFPNLCDPIISYNTPYLLNTSYSTTVDLQGNRYAHLRECEYYKSDYSGLTTFTRNNDYSLPVSAYNRQPQGDIWDTWFEANNTSTRNSNCEASVPTSFSLVPMSYHLTDVTADLLDTSNGKWYIQYKMTAPSTKIINVILPDANLSGTNQTPFTSKATINIFSDGTLQTWACCPLGSSWKSTVHACVSETCAEWQFFCASESKCLAGGATCSGTVCIDNNICEWTESCQCADCTNGGTDDKAKCGLDGTNQQLLCTKDVTASTATTQVGACCPVGKTWNALTNACITKTCTEGQFFCAGESKCLAGGATCSGTVCIDNNICEWTESCQCSDCVNGGSDDGVKCGIIWSIQAVCSDDNLGDGKPGACCVPPKQWNTQNSSCTECNSTQAPSEIKASVDEPYITCTGNGDLTKTHFRYRLTKQGSTDVPFVSGLFTLGTQVLHPTLAGGTYTVECFYGTGASVDTSVTATPHSCTKTMTVNDTAQGCSRIYPYKWSTLSNEMISTSAFDASFRCGSRQSVAGSLNNPYAIRIGTQPISYLQFDSLISELFNGLAIGPVSPQNQNHNFMNGTTEVSCAVKVGGGYSTNSACRLHVCVGNNCETQQTFSVVNSGDILCTNQSTAVYNIGCNPEAPDTVRNECIQWFRDAVATGSKNVGNGVEFDVDFTFNNTTPTKVKCIKYAAGKAPDGLNLSDNVVCRATLNNGENYQIYTADTGAAANALQTTARTVELDREAPTMGDIKYYTDDSLSTEISPSVWYNKPIVAVAVCSDKPLTESTLCACAQTVDPSTTDAAFWSVGSPDNVIGADLMRYTRTITSNLTGTQTVRITDMAGNQSWVKTFTVPLIDSQIPMMTVTESGTTIKSITLTINDTDSKIWKTTTAPTGATNTQGIIYRVGLKSDIATLTFQEDCNIPPLYASVAEAQVASYPTIATVTIPNVDTNTQVVAYCTRDNAGNTTRGIYPVVSTACFSASNMETIPNLDTYEDITKTRLATTLNDNLKYGYTFSKNTTDANCFRGILASNVTTLLTNQLTPRTTTNLSNWNTDRAFLKNTSTLNSSGFYYYVYPSKNSLNVSTSPTWTGTKSVVVEGGDIHIKTNIEYTGSDKILLLIARKNNNGQGGNIIVDPSVIRIDATLIADGGVLTSSDINPGERLVINGSLYSYNTRGGSFAVSGGNLINSTTPKKFINSTLTSASNLADSQDEDLERFRPMFADGSTQCSLHINYQAFTMTTLPALLKRPGSYVGGSCGF